MNNQDNILGRNAVQGERIDAGAYSIVGTRKYQQDFAGLEIKEGELLAVICDGMGGLRGGELAASQAVRQFLSDYLKEGSESFCAEYLTEEARKLDLLISELKDKSGAPLNAGSTIVAVMLKDSLLHWLSVGDSRIYILRRDSMVQVTKDHNYKNQLKEALDAGVITMEKYQKEASGGQAEALVSYLGMGGLKRVETNLQPFGLEEDDVILLCSDGVYKSLEDDQIKAMLTDNKISSPVSAKRLVNMALEQAVKGQDNTTVLIIHYIGSKREEPQWDAVTVV